MRRRFRVLKYSRELSKARHNNPSQEDLERITRTAERIRDGLEDIDLLGRPSSFWCTAYQKLACNHRMIFSHNVRLDMIVLIEISKYP